VRQSRLHDDGPDFSRVLDVARHVDALQVHAVPARLGQREIALQGELQGMVLTKLHKLILLET
jgi:hypothetical protein